jgi:hypothetical protein
MIEYNLTNKHEVKHVNKHVNNKMIIYKENENGLMCLFDSRSEKFFPQKVVGCCVRDTESPNAKDLLGLANLIARKPFKNILELAQSMVYNDNGYLECLLAKAYVEINPDLKEKVLEKLNKPKVNKKMEIKGKRGRKPKEKLSITKSENKKGRGRPRKTA